MKIKVSNLLIAALLVSSISGCASAQEGSAFSSQTVLRSESTTVDKAYPYVFEKGIGYSGDLTSREAYNCTRYIHVEPNMQGTSTLGLLNGGNLWDPTSPIVKNSPWYEKLKANTKKGEVNAIGEISMTLLLLLQVYHPDKVGMELLFDATTNRSGISIVGKNTDQELSWEEVIKKLDIPEDKASAELATLISSNSPKVKVKYVENNAEKLCLAAKGIETDLFGTGYLAPDNHRITFDPGKDMIKFSLRAGTTAIDGGVFGSDSLPPTTLAEIDYTVDIEELIASKYDGLMYYSEF
ncbi:MAG: hypothetical protein MSC45_05510 [Mobiluncus sp.]|uniref:hypothetical protein n=1 Tax=Mobiluncus sp. TaxID=47293 RepID=UPI00258FB60A|nr:hypothetical protein [Mobiluncus sp.]MCI6584508.1 hypothetical protein [Mobiluncus sp.]